MARELTLTELRTSNFPGTGERHSPKNRSPTGTPCTAVDFPDPG